MSTSKTRFMTAIANWVGGITKAAKNASKPIVNVEVGFAAGQVRNYDIADLVGADAADYDLGSCDIQVLVLDTDSASGTNGYFINAEGIIRVGIKNTGEVSIQNFHTAAITARVRIGHPARNS